MEKLPEEKPVHFEAIDDAAAEGLARNGVIVLANFLSQDEIQGLIGTTRKWLVVGAPLQVGRRLLDGAVEEPHQLPVWLQRKALTVTPSRVTMSPEALKTVDRTREVNADLFKHSSLSDIYGAVPPELNLALFNRTPPNQWFPVHQDGPRFRGFGFSPQTDQKLWHILATETIPGSEDFTFVTSPGDLVILRERAGEFGASQQVESPRTGDVYTIDASVVHTGLNVSPTTTSYTMNLFAA